MGASHWFKVETETDAWEVVPPWERRSQLATRKTRKGPDNRYIETLFFIPFTPHSSLKQRLTKLEADLGFQTRVKFVEEMGLSLREKLCRAEPNPRACGRPDCFPCKTAPGKCMRQGGLYTIKS